MDVVMLSRLQFAVTVFFHFIFVPLTLGLVVLLAIMETLYVRTGNEVYKRMTKFWGKLFLINFVLGVVTGITLEFQFGTNWSRYSEYVGDIFGSLLAIEATAAFFLESTFLAVWAFGWERVSKKIHLTAIWLVAIASNLSALWIILANGWMQNPVGYVIKNGRAELSSFFEVVTNPFAWQVVAEMQPAKLAAMESHWETGTHVPMYLLTWPDQDNHTNSIEALPIPGLLSLLAFNSPSAEVKGLDAFPAEDIPPVLPTFLSFRFMVACAGLFVLLAIAAWWRRKDLENHPLLMKALIYVIPLPYLGIMAGWAVAEIGRQPWIVYGLMRTSDAVSPVPTSSVGLSLAAFIVIYTFLGILDIYLLRKYAKKGPEAAPEAQA